MKNFSMSIIIKYEVGRLLNREFIENIRNIFTKLNNNEAYDNYHISFISVIRTSYDSKTIEYSFFNDEEKILIFSFKKDYTNRYTLTFKDNMGNEIVSISADNFDQIAKIFEVYLTSLI